MTKLTLSSSWITDTSSSVKQHLQYLPFGEQFIDQRQIGHDIRFKFTGKERDSETGYSYFGARYYDAGLSVWLSAPLVRDSIAFHLNNNRLDCLINKPKQQNPNSATCVNTVHEPYLHR